MKPIQPRNDFERWAVEYFAGNDPTQTSVLLKLGADGDYRLSYMRDARDGWWAAIQYVREVQTVPHGGVNDPTPGDSPHGNH